MMFRRQCLSASLMGALAISGLMPTAGQAQEEAYPTRPVQMVVAIRAGGSVDFAGRLTAEALGERLGQNFVVENIPGAGGQIGMNDVKNATPDGYRILFGTAGPITILPQRPSVAEELDPLEDFEPVALLYSVPLVPIVKKGGKFETLQDLIDAAKENPGQISYGTTGVGSINHIAAELFSSLADVELLHIPYKGSAPVIADLVGDRIDVYFATLTSWKTSQDRLDALAVAAEERSVFAPELPTAAEAGLPGYEMSNWGGVFVPAGTPQPVINTLEAALEDMMQDDEVRAKFEAGGNEPSFRGGAEAKAEVEETFKKFEELVEERDLNLDL